MRNRRPGRRASSALAAASAILVLIAMGFPAAASAQEGANSPESGGDGPKVLIVATPRLTWETVSALKPPNLLEFFANSATAMNSPRTVGALTTPGEAYLTISAGNRASSLSTLDGRVVELTETTESGNAIEEYSRATGVTPSGEMVALALPSIERTNNKLLFGAVAGSLASALRGDDMTMAAIANADRTLGVPKYRHAALAAMDTDGQVFAGAVGQYLLSVNPAAPWGLQLDSSAVLDEFDSAWDSSDVTLVELSDLERAETGRSQATANQADELFADALERSDDLFGELMARVDPETDLVMVVSPTSPGPRNALTVFAAARPGIDPGLATSSTTRRDGYVTLTDIAPTVLDFLDVEVPDAMGDTRITSADSESDLDERISWMVTESEEALTRDKAHESLTIAFILLLVLILALATLSLALYRSLAPYVRFMSLCLLAVLPASYLVGALPTAGSPPALLGLIILAVGVALAALATLLARFDSMLPPVSLVAFLWLVLAVDVLTGGQLQINTLFGYSPIVAGRFSGFGNQAYSMFALAALLVASYFVEVRTPEGRPAGSGTLAVVSAFYAVTIVIDGHPSLGSDVGGVLSFAPAAAVSLMLFAQRKIRVRTLILIAGVTVLAIVGFAALDLARPPESQTHLGRFASQIADGEAGEILRRKLAANLRVLTAVWAWIIPAAMLYVGYLTWRPTRTLKTIEEQHPQFRAFGLSALILGVGAMALNDSGVSLPAIMLAISLLYVTYMVLGVPSAFADRSTSDD